MSSLNLYLDKLKKLPQDKIAQGVVVLLLIYIASILANLSYLAIPGGHSGANISSPARSGGNMNAAGMGSSVNINSLSSMNIFGTYIPPSAVEKKVEPVVAINDNPEPTNLNLTLSATVAEDNNSGKGTAIVQSGSSQGTYGIDDKIDGTTAIVKQVFSDRIIIQNGMKRETLMLDGVEYDRNNVPRKVDQPNNNPVAKDRYTKGKKDDRRNDLSLTRELAQRTQEIKQNPTKLYDLVRFTPHRPNGQLMGYRLNPGKEPNLFKQAGFRPNDLAVEVNGRPLNDIKAAMEVLREFRTMTEANIVVERDGIRTEILFSLDSNANAVKDDGRKRTRGGLVERR